MLLTCGLAVATVTASTSSGPSKDACETNEKENVKHLDKTRDTAKDASEYVEQTHDKKDDRCSKV